MLGVPGPIELSTEISIPVDTVLPPGTGGKIVLHNDPSIDLTKAWPWESVRDFVGVIGPDTFVLLGSPGPTVTGTIDMRGRTTLVEAAAIIRAARCYVGIDSGLMWIAASLQVPTIGLYGTSYLPAFGAIQPKNPNAVYFQSESNVDEIPPERVVEALQRRRDALSTIHNTTAF
jgi:ADP-heptose:LPS heptosyltransferase